MTAFASLALLNNAAATVTFIPQSIDSSGVAKWITQDSVYDARKVVTMSVTLPKNGSSVARIKQKVIIPVMDTVDASKKLSDAYINIEVVLPKQCSETVRLDLRAYGDALLKHVVSTAAFQNLEAIY